MESPNENKIDSFAPTAETEKNDANDIQKKETATQQRVPQQRPQIEELLQQRQRGQRLQQMNMKNSERESSIQQTSNIQNVPNIQNQQSTIEKEKYTKQPSNIQTEEKKLETDSENLQENFHKKKYEKTPRKPTNTKKPSSAKNKTKKIASIAVFATGLAAAGALAITGFSLKNELVTRQAVNPSNLPIIALKDAAVEESGLSTTEIVAKVVPSVVSIDLYEENSLQLSGSGSGIIFSEDGYIVTNAHVIEDAYAIRVILADGTGYRASLVGQDLRNDLAVIKINAENLVAADFANSDQVQIGEKVIAIGNAAGMFPGSPTQGIISGVNREMPMTMSDGGVVYRTLLQTDAAINPGNSGGALVNSYGQVVGVNVAKLNSSGIENIGFAIPSNVVTQAAAEIFEVGTVNQMPVMGLTLIQLNETNGPIEGLPEKGLYIDSISEYSSLYNNKEVSKGDIVVSVNGQEVTDTKQVRAILEQLTAGDTIELGIYRPEKDDTITVSVELYLVNYDE